MSKQKKLVYSRDRAEVIHEFNKDYMPSCQHNKPYLSVKPNDVVYILNTAQDYCPAALVPLNPISRRRTWIYACKEGTKEVGFVPSTYLNIQYPNCIFGPDAMDIQDIVYQCHRCCPLFLDQAFQLYEQFGKVLGIFRESAPVEEKDYLMDYINRQKEHSLALALRDFYQTYEHKQLDGSLTFRQIGEQLKVSTLHIIAGLIKQFFGDMPNKLFQHHVIEFLLGLEDLVSEKSRQYAAVVQKNLEYEEFLILRYLLYFLYRTSQYAKTTKMEAEYLGQLFSPNLMEDDNPGILTYMIKKQSSLEAMWAKQYPLPKHSDDPLTVYWRYKYLDYNLNQNAEIVKDFSTNDPQMLYAKIGDALKVILVHKRWVFGQIGHAKGWIPLLCIQFTKSSRTQEY